MPRNNIGLKFDNGRLLLGRWNIPSSAADPTLFCEVARDIGFYIALEIERGAKQCEFIDLDEWAKGNETKVSG